MYLRGYRRRHLRLTQVIGYKGDYLMGLLKETPKVYLGHRTNKGLGAVHRTHLCAKPLISEKREMFNKTLKSSVTRPGSCTVEGGSWENIAWVMTIECSGHKSHGSWWPSTNSQDTLPQHPQDHFLINFFLQAQGQCIHDVENHCLVTALSLTSSVVNSLLKRKKHPLRVHITLAIEGRTAAAVAIVASTFASSGTHTLFSQKRDVN